MFKKKRINKSGIKKTKKTKKKTKIIIISVARI